MISQYLYLVKIKVVHIFTEYVCKRSVRRSPTRWKSYIVKVAGCTRSDALKIMGQALSMIMTFGSDDNDDDVWSLLRSLIIENNKKISTSQIKEQRIRNIAEEKTNRLIYFFFSR